MPKSYGFNANRPSDRMAISNVLYNADEVSDQTYDTLAQYQIDSVELQPAEVGLGLPQPWQLLIRTQLMGFNLPNQQSMYFADGITNVDSSIVYHLDATDFADMIKGGLYINARKYMENLENELQQKQFYRRTQVNLTTALIKDNHLDIAVGDFTPQQMGGHQYLIGQELTPYQDFLQPKKQLDTDLAALINSQVHTLLKDPVDTPNNFHLDEPVAQMTTEMPVLPQSPSRMRAQDNALNFADTPQVISQPQSKVQFEAPDNEQASSEKPLFGNDQLPEQPKDQNELNNAEQQSNTKKRSQMLSNENKAQSEQPSGIQDTKFDDTAITDLSALTAKLDSMKESKVDYTPNSNVSNGQLAEPQNDGSQEIAQQPTVEDTTSVESNSDQLVQQPDSVAKKQPNLEEVMQKLSALSTQNKQTRSQTRSHVYVDDFAKALHSSQQQQQRLKKLQQSKTVKDSGLER